MKLRRAVVPAFLALVFLGPLIAAVVLYVGPGTWTSRGTAHGELLDPPVPLPSIALTTPAAATAETIGSGGSWSILYAHEGACRRACLAFLDRLNQVRLALGEDRHRVRLVLLYAGAKPALPENAEILLGRLDDPKGAAAWELLAAHGARDGRAFVADPLGNLVLSYGRDAPQQGIFEDLDRLIELSVIR